MAQELDYQVLADPGPSRSALDLLPEWTLQNMTHISRTGEKRSVINLTL